MSVQESLETQLAECQSRLAAAEGARATAEERATDAEKARAETEARAAEAEKARAEAEARAAEAEKACAEAKERTSQAEKARAEAEARVAEAEKACAEAKEQASEAKRACAEAKERASEAENARARAEARATYAESMERDAKEAAEKARAAEVRVWDGAEARVAEAEDRIAETKARTTEAEAKLAIVEKKAEAAAEAMARAEVSVRAAEASMKRGEEARAKAEAAAAAAKEARIIAEQRAMEAEEARDKLAEKVKAMEKEKEIIGRGKRRSGCWPVDRCTFAAGLVGLLLGALVMFVLLTILSIQFASPSSRQSTTYVDHRYLFSITYKPDQNWSRSENVRGGEQGVVISRNPDISWLYDSTKPEGIYVRFVSSMELDSIGLDSCMCEDSPDSPETQLRQLLEHGDITKQWLDSSEPAIMRERNIGGGVAVGAVWRGTHRPSRTKVQWYEALVFFPDAYSGDRLYGVLVVAPVETWDTAWPIYEQVINGIKFQASRGSDP